MLFRSCLLNCAIDVAVSGGVTVYFRNLEEMDRASGDACRCEMCLQLAALWAEQPRKNAFLNVKPIGRLLNHHALLAVDHLGSDFFAPMGR